jgi:hypothetical protein
MSHTPHSHHVITILSQLHPKHSVQRSGLVAKPEKASGRSQCQVPSIHMWSPHHDHTRTTRLSGRVYACAFCTRVVHRFGCDVRWAAAGVAERRWRRRATPRRSATEPSAQSTPSQVRHLHHAVLIVHQHCTLFLCEDAPPSSQLSKLPWHIDTPSEATVAVAHHADHGYNQLVAEGPL